MPDKNDYFEAHVSHLLSFTLGFVAAINADRKMSPHTPPDANLISFDGSRLDQAMGDKLLSSQGQWFILELKKGDQQLEDELSKKRVMEMRANLDAIEAIFAQAETAHQFLYLAKEADATGASPRVTLATLGYLGWLRDAVVEGKLIDFLEFVSAINPSKRTGFIMEELEDYVWFMERCAGDGAGDGEHDDGGNGSETDDMEAAAANAADAIADRLIACIDDANHISVAYYSTLKLQLAQAAANRKNPKKPRNRLG